MVAPPNSRAARSVLGVGRWGLGVGGWALGVGRWGLRAGEVRSIRSVRSHPTLSPTTGRPGTRRPPHPPPPPPPGLRGPPPPPPPPPPTPQPRQTFEAGGDAALVSQFQAQVE